MNGFDTYRSPYSWRYGSDQLRSIWSEEHKRRLWRKLWLALAEIQMDYGIVSVEQVEDLRAHAEAIDVARALEFESELKHDVMAEIRTYAEQCPVGGGVIHLGMTSMDVVDNADALRVKASLELILRNLRDLLVSLSNQVLANAGASVMGYTHLQPAEPTTLGYRLAQYLQDLHISYMDLVRLLAEYRGKGLKGAVGTRASYQELFGSANLEQVEAQFSRKIDLEFFPVTTQTYPRMQDYRLLSSLAGIAAVLNKFAYDLRILQMPAIGEWAEPRRKKQVGSTAMPFKHNPIQAENINSLARLVAQLPRVAWDDAAYNLLERTLDDSANRRSILPEGLLIVDQVISSAKIILNGIQFDLSAARRNLETFSVFAAQEPLLMALVKAGADRQEMHERLRQYADSAWQEIRAGHVNPLAGYLKNDAVIAHFLDQQNVENILDSSIQHLGEAESMANRLAARVLEELKQGG